MEVCRGRCIYPGIAVGKIHFYQTKQNTVIRAYKEDTKGEIARYEWAKKETLARIEALYEKAFNQLGKDAAAVFSAHKMLVLDEEFSNAVYEEIEKEKVNAEYAISTVGQRFLEMFAGLKEDYFKARMADVFEVVKQLVSVLTDARTEYTLEEPVILVAKDLTPGEVLQLDTRKVLAFVTEESSTNSHMAILAKTRGITTITGIPIEPDWHGKMALVDGEGGRLCLEPDEEILEEAKLWIEKKQKERQELGQLKGKENVTTAGKKIEIYANAGSLEDVENAMENDAGGIGLYRSECLYLEKTSMPTEEEQFLAYKQMLEKLEGKPLVVRTLDIGADKQLPYFPMEEEENPALGCRGIRFILKHRDIFKTQLRAIFRAGVYGNLSVMYPMITSLEEIRQIKEIAMDVKQSLEDEMLPYKEVSMGIMIETPAGALISDLLAEEVDFFSVGSNDLSQYTFAKDRESKEYFIADAEVTRRWMQWIVKSAHEKHIPVGICGELATDAEWMEFFIEIGVDSLSVLPTEILSLRKKIREL